MARCHQRKRKQTRAVRSLSSSPSLAVAVVAVALLTHGAADLTFGRRVNSSLDTEARKKFLRGSRRRARAEGSVRGGSSKVNLLVKYKNGSAHTRSLSNYESNNSTPHTWQAHTTSISTISEDSHIAAVEIDANEIDLVIDEMMADGDIVLVEEDFPMYKYPYNSIQTFDTPDQYLHLRHKQRLLTHRQNRTLMESQQYGIAQTQASAIWALTESKPNKYLNSPVKVCIVDTGYDSSHEDLPKVGVTSTNTGYGDPLQDGDGHGTHCAGVIGAVGNNGRGIVGVNPDPTKFSFHIAKALNDDGMGTASSVLKGIKGCISSGSKIISMSLGGGPKSSIFNELYKEAYDNDVLVFAAAGNVGAMRDDYPASYPLVVSVGAVDRFRNRANFSNWNDQLELMGPGKDIVSTFPGNGYGMLSGTSMATPYVAGVAALVWGYFPQCSNQQIRNVLARSARSMTSSGVGCNRRTGFGLVQAKSAFDLLDKYGCAAGGQNYSPPSAGGVGGCDQPLADVSKLTPVSDLNTASFSTGVASGNGCQRLFLKMLTDDYAYETSWELKRADNGEILDFGPPGSRNFEDKTEYIGPASGCLDAGIYEFSIIDLFGDGLTAPAYYSVSLNGEELIKNSNFGHKETTTFTINNSPAEVIQQPDWTPLLFENFSNGFGKFNDGGSNVMHVGNKFGRSGLVMMKKGTTDFEQASVYSENIPVKNRGFMNFKVVFSFYANSMEVNDRFCLDYSSNGASKWSRAKCWRSGGDFDNGKWNDNETCEFRPSVNFAANSIRIR
eukprot:CAMPEP_0172545124 /NCGR_PEP_ID=MMETSP1067-20121228/15122_1 /TAXON_ID=265564 ORGANISM="Thalassiosira punctigera, Strain Tpunct2005C2" /NCGR_SAMPLE_ID=MMETSP1067 /ASSEMBLY_ACC=CAM_ASM_000444 /LENGTH=780 /DNA_ID=CAMNT_0013331809 /DNA_START=135 /DNA_END=2474 /DNA_ORIENTATION=-